MEELYRKYETDRLTIQDLDALRNANCTEVSKGLEDYMRKEWIEGDLNLSSVSDDAQSRVKSLLDEHIRSERSVMPLYVKILSWAAGILLPLFIISTFYLYHENKQALSEEMIVTTGPGERATITLPDNTQVTLNTQSKLTYIPKVYNKEERRIKFSGEAYFNVAKNADCPFFIDAKGLNVKVLGTKFNLLVRQDEPTAELLLESGSVLFSSLVSGKSAILKPSQKVIMDQLTGKLIIVADDIRNISSWRKNELVFRNIPLSSVIISLEIVYGIRIDLNCKECSTDLFTGTLVTNDINGDLEVIEKAYHLKATMNERKIIISRIE